MFQMRLSGAGGQGLILLGIILAEAAILDNKYAVQSQSYGPEARGGASKAEVIIADDKINYPKVTQPQLFLAMTQEALDKYSGDLAQDSTVIVDSAYVKNLSQLQGRTLPLPITQTSKNEFGRELFANIVALGAIVALTKVVSLESATVALMQRVPSGTEEMNKRALALGRALVK
jgi:2-oxoglutarate ferredoxin oxidoreductase subunit gamma